MTKTYDLIIVGAGPAGMTAAIYAARRKINFLILGMDIGGQMSWSSEVENYPGTTHSTGGELVRNFQKHMEVYGVKVKPEEIIKVGKKGELCFVKSRNKEYLSKAVIIASGKKPKKLNVPGEDRLASKGVGYCATCDAPLYKDKVVVVVGGGNSGLEAAEFLAKYAKKVYLMESMPNLGGEAYLRDKVVKDKKVQVLTGVKIKEVKGKNFVSSLIYEEEGKDKEINVDGIFIEIGLVSKSDFIDVQKNRWGEIMLFRSTKTHEENMTSVSGIFAAGDVTDVPAKQIVAAAGEGCKAALASFDYISRFDKKKNRS
jgi:thioredoxin-disulfide reductase